jgi:hypothetical protein
MTQERRGLGEIDSPSVSTALSHYQKSYIRGVYHMHRMRFPASSKERAKEQALKMFEAWVRKVSGAPFSEELLREASGYLDGIIQTE